MDTTTQPDGTTDLPWPSGDHRMRVADQWRARQGEWAEGLRTTVRSHPLKSMVAALALGAVIARAIR